MKKILLVLMYVMSILFVINTVNAIIVGSCSQKLNVKYYTVPETVTHSICLENKNDYEATITMEASSNIAGMIDFAENPVTLQPDESKYVDFDVSVTQQSTWDGTINLNFYVPEDNFPNGVWPVDITISKGTLVCEDGETQDCTIDDCPGTQTCQANEWGDCVKDDPECGVDCEENWECTEWTECTDGTQTRTCEDLNECGTEDEKPITFRACTVNCTENWDCTEWTECINETQTRTCEDLNSCGTDNDKPAESQACSLDCQENWTCTAWSACQPSNTQTRTCTDENNCNTTNNKPAETQACTYTAGSSGGGSSGGGGSGGGGSLTGEIYYVPDTDFNNGYKGKLKEDDRFKFNCSDEDHSLKVSDIKTDEIQIVIYSTPKSYYLKEGDQENYDLNEDGEYDLYVEVIDIDKPNNEVELKIKQYSDEPEEEVNQTNEINQTTEINETNNINHTNSSGMEDITGQVTGGNNNTSFGTIAKIGSIVLAVIIIVTISVLIYFKKIKE